MKRDTKLDILRIISIVLVIIIHITNIYCLKYPSISDNNYLICLIYNAISRVCVPIFFMISGSLLIKSEYNKDKYKKRVFKFILILIIWSIIYYLIRKYYLGYNLNLFTSIITSLYEPTKTQRHLWFMYAIIGIYIVLPFIQNMCKNLTKELENIFIILFISLNGLSSLYIPLSQNILSNNINIIYPIPIIQGTYYLGYFILGHIIYKRITEKQINIDLYKKILFLIPIVSNILIVTITYFKTIEQNLHYDTMLWYKNIFIMLSAISIFSLTIASKKTIKNTNIINNLSTNSFGIYLTHMIFLNIINKNIDIIHYNPIISIPILTTIIYLCSYVLCHIIRKIPYINKIIG